MHKHVEWCLPKIVALLALCLASVAVFAKAPPRAMVRSFSAAREANSNLLARYGLHLVEDYGSFMWVEASADVLRSAALQSEAAVSLYPGWDMIRTIEPFSAYERPALKAITSPGLYLVHFIGPIKPEWLQSLLNNPSCHYVEQFPEFGAIIWVGEVKEPITPDFHAVDWLGAYEPAYRISKAVGTNDASIQPNSFIVEFANMPGVWDDIYALAKSVALDHVEGGKDAPFLRALINGATIEQIEAAAELPRVLWIEPLYIKVKMDEIQGQIVAGNYSGAGPTGTGYMTWLSNNGFSDLSSVTIDVCDDGWDTGNLTVGLHNAEFDTADGTQCRVVGFYDLCSGDTFHGLDGHGNINQSITIGRGVHANDPNGYGYGIGIAPTAKGYHTRIFGDAGSFCGDPLGPGTVSNAYNAGARVTSNSWGANTAGAYDTDSQAYDMLVRDTDENSANGLQPMTVVFAAGNAGPSASTVGSPGTAKNVITSGASENYRMTGTDGCGVANSGADNLNDVIDFSSRGPCADGRRRPDATAPGTHIEGAASQYSGYTGNSVCDKYWPNDGQTWYAWSSGTSHSTPAMAGVAGIIYEWYHALKGTDPSPAMVKAIMDGTADDMYGGDNGNGGTLGHYPDNSQGWGRVNMGRLVDSAAKYTYDQAHIFTASGQTYSPVPIYSVMDASKPVRIMLAWTDAPGNPNASPSGGLANNLDLTVTADGNTYLGNVFSNGWSATGGTADIINNTEAVYLPAGTATSFTVSIAATSLSGDGVPGSGTSTDQDFALFIYNATDQTSAGIITLDKPVYRCSDTIAITVSDADLKDPSPSATMAVAIASTTEPSAESVTLTQTGASTGVYTGSIATTTSAPPSVGQLSLSNGDTITATYHDADHGGGSPADVTAAASADCQGPVISNVLATNVTGNSADITWTTDELADSYTAYDTAAPPTAHNASSTALATSHALHLTGLAQCTTYYFYVRSTDSVGNQTADTNGGAYYTFSTGMNVTPTYTKTETPPLAIPDNSPTGASSVIAVSDSKVIQKVTVTINSITHTFDGDLTLYLIGPDATQVTLSARHGSSGDNFVNTVFDDAATTAISAGAAPFTGSFTPDSPLSAFNGKNALGNWTLKVVDSASLDTGTIDQWSITFTYPPQSCGPSLEEVSRTFTDACSGTGTGVGNGFIDPGEDITLTPTLHNNGTSATTGIWAAISTSTPGVSITDNYATFPDIPADGTGVAQADYYGFRVDPSVTCGTTLNFSIHIVSNESPAGWDDTFTMTVGLITPGGSTPINEAFASGDPPTGWTLVNGGTGTQRWTTTNPGGRTAPSGITDPFEIIDSDYDGSGNTQDDSLITPAFDCTGATAVTLTFDTYFNWYSSSDYAYVDVSSDGGATWLNKATWTADVGSSTTASHQVMDITSLAGTGSNVKVRFHYIGSYGWYWMVDNVKVDITATGSCTVQACTPTPLPPGEVSRGDSPATALSWTGTTTLGWQSASGATGYKVYRGVLLDLPNLLNTNTDSCTKYTGPDTSCSAGDDPAQAAGGFYWYLVTGTNGGGEGTAGNATGQARIVNSSATCP